METTNLFKALASFQQEVPVIHKDTQGYGYTYADLPQIFEVINPILKKHGLGFSQPIDGNSIKTIIFHIETGEAMESTINIPEGVQLKGMNDFQVLGSAITYLRRYALSSILGLITDKDNDASGEQTQKSATQNTSSNTDERPWLTEAQYNQSLTLNKLQISKVLKDFRMKKEYKEALTKLTA